MSDEVISSFEAYVPKSSAREWERVRRFVLDVVALSGPPAGREQRVLKIAAPFVLWCVAEQGLPVEAASLFRPVVIDAYCRQVSGNPRTAATYRSVLVRIAERVAPQEKSASMTAIPRAFVQPPYTRDELVRFRAWANGQNKVLKVRRARLLLSLGAGAGLAVREIAALRYADVLTGDGVVLRIHQPDGSAREVPMLGEWEGVLLEAMRDLPEDGWLWTPKRPTTGNSAISDFAAGTIGAAPVPTRLRTTWLTTHLQLGTPMPALFAAAGFKRWDNLHQYLAFVASTPEAVYRAQLRGPNA